MLSRFPSRHLFLNNYRVCQSLSKRGFSDASAQYVYHDIEHLNMSKLLLVLQDIVFSGPKDNGIWSRCASRLCKLTLENDVPFSKIILGASGMDFNQLSANDISDFQQSFCFQLESQLEHLSATDLAIAMGVLIKLHVAPSLVTSCAKTMNTHVQNSSVTANALSTFLSNLVNICEPLIDASAPSGSLPQGVTDLCQSSAIIASSAIHLFTSEQCASMVIAFADLHARDVEKVQFFATLVASRLIQPAPVTLKTQNMSKYTQQPNSVGSVSGEDAEEEKNLRLHKELSKLTLVRLIHALSRLSISHDLFFKLAMNSLENSQTLNRLNPDQLKKIIFAAARVKGNKSSLLDLACNSIRKRLNEFSILDLSQILMSLGRAQVSNPVLLSRTATLIKREFDPILYLKMPNNIDKFPLVNKQHANLPDAHINENSNTLNDFSRGPASRISAFDDLNASAVVNLAGGFALNLHMDKRLFECLSKILRDTKFRPLSSLHVPFNDSNSDGTDKFQIPLGDSSSLRANRLGKLTVVDLVSILVYWSKVHVLDEDLFQEVAECLLSRPRNEFTLDQCVMLLNACRRMECGGWRHLGLFKRVVNILEVEGAFGSNLTLLQLVTVINAMENLNIRAETIFQNAAKILPSDIKLPEEVEWRGNRITKSWIRAKSARVRKRDW